MRQWWFVLRLKVVSSLVDFARRGGTVICFLPEGPLAEAAGLVYEGEKDVPLRLRVTAYPAAGMAGERFPIVGHANNYSPAPGVQVLGYFSYTDRYEGESVGITETTVGQGRIVGFAFDLALCVLLLRQGDPNLAEVIPEGTGCARPSSHCDQYRGLQTPAGFPLPTCFPGCLWIQCGVICRVQCRSCRICRGWHPASSFTPVTKIMRTWRAMMRNSSDVAAAGRAHESLYYSEPDKIYGVWTWRGTAFSTMWDRIRIFGRWTDALYRNVSQNSSGRSECFKTSSIHPRDLCAITAQPGPGIWNLWRLWRNWVWVWMGNYFSGTYGYGREDAPYAAFGGAMPMRFCWPDGRVLNVFQQQHTQLADDIMFGTADYSYRLSPQVFAGCAGSDFHGYRDPLSHALSACASTPATG